MRWSLLALLLLLVSGVACQTPDPCRNLCEPGQFCSGGLCVPVCQEGQARCVQSCVDLLTDPRHCGACGEVCESQEVCVGGVCQVGCPASTPALCFGLCVDTNNDPANCGGCRVFCAKGQSCVEGKCICATGFTLCGGTCVKTAGDRAHCGGCGKECADDQICLRGLCARGACPRPTPTLCLDGCTELQRDRRNCGSCNKVCDGDKLCIEGQCTCPPGFLSCANDRCIDPKSNVRHCGRCQHACDKGQICAGGRCLNNCPASTSSTCFGGCVDVQTDVKHCGKCGRECEPGLLCVDGVCCPSGSIVCEGQCIDPNNSVAHCGACQNKCSTGDCELGVCCQDKCSRVRIIDGTGGFDATGVRYVSDSSILVLGGYDKGDFRLSDSLTLPFSLPRSIFVAEFNSDWKERSLGGIAFRNNNAIRVNALGALPADGGFVIGASLLKDAAFPSIGGTDAFVLSGLMRPQYKRGWTAQIGGSGEEIVTALEVDAQGGVIITGETKSGVLAGRTLPYQGGVDVMLARIKPDGTLDWIQTFGGTKDDLVQALTLDAKGNIYIAGLSYQPSAAGVIFGGKRVLFNGAAPQNGFVAKIDPKGQVIWAKAFESPIRNAFAYYTAMTAETNNGQVTLYLAGVYHRAAAFGGVSFQNQKTGLFTPFLLSLQEDGSVHWAKEMALVTQALNERQFVLNAATHMAIDTKGTLHVGGSFSSYSMRFANQTTLFNQGGADAFVARYDRQGLLKVVRQIGGVGTDALTGLDVSPGGTTYVVGYTNSSVFRFLEKDRPINTLYRAAYLLRWN